MIAIRWARLGQALSYAAHSGFPWAAGGASDGSSTQLRRAIRRSMVERWPRPVRIPGKVLMTLLWPLKSLKDAFTYTIQMNRAALGRHHRAVVALRAWSAALRHNLPPVDYLSYRLFEAGRPGPQYWLHSADSHRHFTALSGSEVRILAEDKLAFAEFAESVGARVMPILAVYRNGLPLRPFSATIPPPQSLMVKPRRGFGGGGQIVWHWRGSRHVATSPVVEPDLERWLSKPDQPKSDQTGDLLIQTLGVPPRDFGLAATPIIPLLPPVLSIITVEWPDRRREVAAATIGLQIQKKEGVAGFSRPVDPVSGHALSAQPGWTAPAWGSPLDSEELGPFAIPDWFSILSEIDLVHAALPGPAPVLKWDVLFTDKGPMLLETNTGTGVYLLQSMTLQPIYQTRLGAVLEAWAR